MDSKITQAINNVYDTLGYGLTEGIYQKVLVIELKESFENVQVEKSVPIIYKNHEIAVLRADIFIDNKFILELKAITTKLSSKDENQ